MVKNTPILPLMLSPMLWWLADFPGWRHILFGAEDVRECGVNDGFVEGGRILVLFKYLVCSLQALIEVLLFAAHSMNGCT